MKEMTLLLIFISDVFTWHEATRCVLGMLSFHKYRNADIK